MGSISSTSFPDKFLTKSPSETYNLEIPEDGTIGWLRKHGRAFASITSEVDSILIDVHGKNNEVYSLIYDTSRNVLTSQAGGYLQTSSEIYSDNGVEFDRILITQKKQFTPQNIITFVWTIDIQITDLPNNLNFIRSSIEVQEDSQYTSVNSSLNRRAIEEPKIQVSLSPIEGFEDLANVVFFVQDGKEHKCAKGKYEQITGQGKIQVLSPFITCYLAGTGDFATQKMASVNGTQNPVWPEVSLYAMVKFILYRLLTGKFDMDIVLRKNTARFLKKLGESEYSNFLEYFEQNKDLEKYFK